MALNTYLTNLQNLLGTGSGGNLYTAGVLTTYINIARNRIAMEGQCIRVLPPISGGITVITLGSGGSGYSGTTTVVFSSPDSPLGSGPSPGGATASATAVTGTSGVITSITLQSAGAGYFLPSVSFSGAGTGATATAVVSAICQTVTNQEVYPFSQINPIVAVSGSGINSIYMVRSVAVLFGTWRYMSMYTSFSKYQALIRRYSANVLTYVPEVACQFGQGQGGSIYLYPVPNAAYQMEWDCCCIPNAVNSDTDVEAIPFPWTDAIIYYAAYLATSGSGRYQDADRFLKEYKRLMMEARRFSEPQRTVTWYGRI